MQYTDNEAALIGGLISNYFFQPSVDAKLRESYRRILPANGEIEREELCYFLHYARADTA